MEHLSVEVKNSVDEALDDGCVYREPEYKSLALVKAVVVKGGMKSGNSTVDLILVDENGQKYVALVSSALLAMVPSFTSDVKDHNESESACTGAHQIFSISPFLTEFSMATKGKNEVATPAQTGLSFSQEVPDYIKQGQARGSEEVGAKDMVLPRLEIVQSQSPIKELNPDARDGQLFNSVTQEILGDFVYFVPIYYRLEWLVWKDADKGGGFFGSFDTQEQAEARAAEAVVEGNDAEDMQIVDTPVQYGLLIAEDGTTQQIVISMAKTKAKVSRKWNAMISIAGGDRFSRVYKISTFTDENKAGKKFKNYVVQPAGYTPKAIYEQAEQMYEVFKVQPVRVAHESGNADDAPGASERGEI